MIFTAESNPKTEKNTIIVYLKILLNNPTNFEKLPLTNTEPNNDRIIIETAKGKSTNFIIYVPVSKRKTEKELKTVADLTAPDKLKKLTRRGNNIPANENKPSTKDSISTKKFFIKNKIVVESKKEKIIFKVELKLTNFPSENDLNIS